MVCHGLQPGTPSIVYIRVGIFVFKAHRLLAKYKWGSVSFLVGLLLGRLTNELSNAETLSDLWKAMFVVKNRPLNWSTWVLIAGVVILIGLSPVIGLLRRRLSYQNMLLAILERLKHPSLAKYNALGVDNAITLALCPEPDRGWMLSEVDIRHDTSQFEFPVGVRDAYMEYKNKHYYEKKLMDDRTVIMLTQTPRVFTDTPTLVLNTKEARFSQVLFFRERMLHEDPSLLGRIIDDVVTGRQNITFPHDLSMHAVVVTKDDYILITKRSPRTEWYGDHWSCSIEESFSYRDLEEGRRGSGALRHWVTRALWEELGLDEESYVMENVRILSVFLESSDVSRVPSVLNICLCVHVPLDIDRQELSKILRVLPRRDYEFTEFDFLDYDELVKELTHATGTRLYHPTSRYRMLLALIRKYGEADFARRILSVIERGHLI